MDFQANSIKGALFFVPGQPQGDALKLWGELFPGDSPDGFRRVTATSPALNSSAYGDRQGFQTTIDVQVGRVDVVIAHSRPPLSTESGPPRIADVAAGIAKVVDLLKRLSATTKVIRTGIVLELAKTVMAGDESSEILKNLPDYPFPANASDVNLQFNSRRGFNFSPDFQMNRLCTWTSGQMGFVVNSQIRDLAPFVSFMIDVNSAPQMHLPLDIVNNAIDELLSEALAIAAEGIGRFRA